MSVTVPDVCQTVPLCQSQCPHVSHCALISVTVPSFQSLCPHVSRCALMLITVPWCQSHSTLMSDCALRSVWSCPVSQTVPWCQTDISQMVPWCQSDCALSVRWCHDIKAHGYLWRHRRHPITISHSGITVVMSSPSASQRFTCGNFCDVFVVSQSPPSVTSSSSASHHLLWRLRRQPVTTFCDVSQHFTHRVTTVSSPSSSASLTLASAVTSSLDSSAQLTRGEIKPYLWRCPSPFPVAVSFPYDCVLSLWLCPFPMTVSFHCHFPMTVVFSLWRCPFPVAVSFPCSSVLSLWRCPFPVLSLWRCPFPVAVSFPCSSVLSLWRCPFPVAAWLRAPNSRHWFTTFFLQPLPYLVTP